MSIGQRRKRSLHTSIVVVKKFHHVSSFLSVIIPIIFLILSCLTGITNSHVAHPSNYYYGSLSPSTYSSSSSVLPSSLSTSPASSTTDDQHGKGQVFPGYLFPPSISTSSFLSSLSSSSKKDPSSGSIFPDRPNRSRYPRIPSCSELREMWMRGVLSNYKDQSSRNGPKGMVHTNEIPKLLTTNPYYYNLVSSREEPIFGSIKNSKNGESSVSETGDAHRIRGAEDTFGEVINPAASEFHENRGQDETDEIYGTIEKSGTFHDRPASASELGPVFGHVIVGPDGGPSIAGTFGSFSSSPIENGSGLRTRQSSQVASRERSSGSRVRGPRTTSSPKTSSSITSELKPDTRTSSKSSSPYSRKPASITANDFFNAVWHDKPVVVGSTNV